ncbi:MAG: hypothetical protein MPF33_03855 [Candidatus Aramenus sp.]|jgi:hypothetical protein|nr:hypothetical protein [Candidatus Aramenus sp.]
MSVKEQRIDSNNRSRKIAELYGLLTLAEDLHEEVGEAPTTDLKKVYVRSPLPEGYEGVETGKAPLPYTVLYDKIFSEYVEFLKEVMAPYTSRTMETGIEFINVLLDSGEFAIFEGEENKVSLPLPSGIALAHTHPGICLFSHKDLETADHNFIQRYVVVAVMNTKCGSFILRKGPYTPEDRESLLSLSKSVKRAKRLEELVDSYKGFKSENLVFTYLEF